jgi:4-methyl-5(b-hydroxyethyl)-thiazole monophosphate biosynthesis
MEVLIFLTDGFEEIETIATIDILRRGGLSVRSVSLTDKKTVIGKHKVAVVTYNKFDDYSQSDFEQVKMLILPGGTSKINEHDGLKQLVLDFAKKGKFIGAICMAPIVLGELGLLKGKKAICYPGYEGYLTDAQIIDQAVVVDGNIITARSVGVTFEFALELLTQINGKEIAEEVAKKMIFLR